jgi:hypothetical protein
MGSAEAAWAAVALAALTLAWAITAYMLARALRGERERATMVNRLGTIARDLDRIVSDKDRTHAEMLAQMREDRQATDVRLRWLETHVWSRQQPRRRDQNG